MKQSGNSTQNRARSKQNNGKENPQKKISDTKPQKHRNETKLEKKNNAILKQ